MISVIGIWLYMLFTCYVTGFACIRTVAGKNMFRCQKETSYTFAGIGIVTVYAQLFSLFSGVGLTANIVLCLICFLCIAIYRTDFLESLNQFRLSITPGKAVVILLLFLLFAYGTSNGLIHYDTGLYHAQSIRWIEEYGVIPGLGNLHSRLAYNSASFALSALYSMFFLGGQSFHCTGGFLAFLLAVVCLEAVYTKRHKKPLLSDLVRLAAVYYLLQIFDEMISPASDYFMVLLVFLVIIRWFELLEQEEKSYIPYALLSVLCVLVLTVKLSGALLLLLVCKPAIMMLSEKKIKEIFKYLGLGIIAVIPYFIRNVILSGWLIYPFTAIDLFSLDYKIPKGMAEYDSREIQVWGRGFSDVTRYGEPITKWLPEWVKGLDGTDKVFLIMAISGILLLIIFLLYALIKKKADMADYLLIAGVLAICFIFWLFSAPLIRYGCVFLWLTGIVTWGYLYLQISPHLDRYRILLIALCIFGVYKAAMFGIEVTQTATTKYLLVQKDYENFATIPYELHGYTFYYPEEGDRTGYQDFPASPIQAGDIFRGETIQEGFMTK